MSTIATLDVPDWGRVMVATRTSQRTGEVTLVAVVDSHSPRRLIWWGGAWEAWQGFEEWAYENAGPNSPRSLGDFEESLFSLPTQFMARRGRLARRNHTTGETFSYRLINSWELNGLVREHLLAGYVEAYARLRDEVERSGINAPAHRVYDLGAASLGLVTLIAETETHVRHFELGNVVEILTRAEAHVQANYEGEDRAGRLEQFQAAQEAILCL